MSSYLLAPVKLGPQTPLPPIRLGGGFVDAGTDRTAMQLRTPLPACAGENVIKFPESKYLPSESQVRSRTSRLVRGWYAAAAALSAALSGPAKRAKSSNSALGGSSVSSSRPLLNMILVMFPALYAPSADHALRAVAATW